MRCWIDTDVGGDPDDSFALWCAVRHPGLELIGVSTVDGDVEWRAAVARDLLAAAGAPDTPVVAGPPPSDFGGADALLAIGPWTHVASAPVLPPRVALMGGMLGGVVHRGKEVWSDWNVEQDRAAAGVVLARDDNLLVVPLDTSVNVVCTPDERAALAATVPAVPDMNEWNEELVLHDPLALLALLADVPMRVERRRLSIGGKEQAVVVWADPAATRARVVDLCMG